MTGPENDGPALEARLADLTDQVLAGDISQNQAREVAGLPPAEAVHPVFDKPVAEQLADNRIVDGAHAAVQEAFGLDVGLWASSVVVGPNDWLFVNLGEHATDADGRATLATLRQHLPAEIGDRIVVVAAQQIAVIVT